PPPPPPPPAGRAGPLGCPPWLAGWLAPLPAPAAALLRPAVPLPFHPLHVTGAAVGLSPPRSLARSLGQLLRLLRRRRRRPGPGTALHARPSQHLQGALARRTPAGPCRLAHRAACRRAARAELPSRAGPGLAGETPAPRERPGGEDGCPALGASALPLHPPAPDTYSGRDAGAGSPGLAEGAQETTHRNPQSCQLTPATLLPACWDMRPYGSHSARHSSYAQELATGQKCKKGLINKQNGRNQANLARVMTTLPP
ncbi:transcription initiation factor TFIID subunit 4-like, partial [Sphaerodactylus townsendi]|uniref:transcription initiation factor TFIID subunit 4-like n=1 Tax=Sphaerodactylus townsendi TaxID=933632 RepID=UPI002026151E